MASTDTSLITNDSINLNELEYNWTFFANSIEEMPSTKIKKALINYVINSYNEFDSNKLNNLKNELFTKLKRIPSALELEKIEKLEKSYYNTKEIKDREKIMLEVINLSNNYLNINNEK